MLTTLFRRLGTFSCVASHIDLNGDSSSMLSVELDSAGSNPTSEISSSRVSLSLVRVSYGQVKHHEGHLGLV